MVLQAPCLQYRLQCVVVFQTAFSNKTDSGYSRKISITRKPIIYKSIPENSHKDFLLLLILYKSIFTCYNMNSLQEHFYL